LVRRAQGNLYLAFEDFRRALRSSRLWRLEVVPASSVRISSELKLQSIYDSFLTTGYEIHRSSPNQKLITELFLASEENRAWSLRQTLREGSNSKFPEEYYELLSQMRSVASRSLNSGNSQAAEAALKSLRSRLTEMEATAGLALPAVGDEA